VALWGILVPLRAQEQPPQQKKQVKSVPQHEGFGRQLAPESREAAGEEENETAEFKQSAAVQWIARKTGLSLQHAYLLCVLLNFAVMGGVLFWASRKYLPGLFRERTSAIQKAMQEAQKASDD
jgi:hypothetical protein